MIWLPYPNVRANLDVLADEHVTDIVLEGMQCLRDIYAGALGRDVRAWRKHPQGLLFYVLSAEKELGKRGMGAVGEHQIVSAFTWISRHEPTMSPKMPSWYGEPAFHLAQRSHLIRVDPVHYARRLPLTTPLELPLIWPVERKIK
jgi:hypothetical protein